MGSLVAPAAWLRGDAQRRLLSPGLLGIAALGFAALAYRCFADPAAPSTATAVLRALSSGALVGALLIRQWAGNGTPRLLDNRLMHWIGVRSYSLYLVHVAAMIAVLQWSGLAPLGPGRFVRMLAIDLPVSIALAALSYAIVERPFLALRGRWRAPRSTDAATEAGGGTG